MLDKHPYVESEEELTLIQEYVVLSIALDSVQKDIETIEKLELISKPVYSTDLRIVQDAMIADQVFLRKRLKASGVKFVGESRSKRTGLRVEYVSRGYERSLSMLPQVIRARVLKAIARYKGIDLTEAAP